MRLLAVTIFVVTVALPAECRRAPPPSPERRLFDDLLSAYDAGSRPVLAADRAVQVNFSIALHQIMDLVEKNQTLVTHVWIHEEWVDEMLTWEPEAYAGTRQLVLPSRAIWLPDLYIFNNADKGAEGFVVANDSRVLVRPDGAVTWVIPLIIKSSCAVDVKYFPFDNQRCQIRFGSWIYEDNQLDIRLKDASGVDVTPYVPNSEFDLLDVSLERVLNPYTIFNGSYPQVALRVHISRRPLYYSYTVLAPTLVLCILTLFTFLLPCDSGDKVGIGLTVFLSLYVLQLAIAENMPESNSLPLIGLFLTLVMTLNSISLVFATLVINIKKKGDLYQCPAVPPLVMAFCKHCLAKITFTRLLNYYDFYETCDEEIELLFPEVAGEAAAAAARKAPTSGTVLKKRGLLGPRRGRGAEEELVEMKKINTRSMKKKRHRIPAPKDPKLEWYFVAEVVDKTLFILFFAAMSTTIVVSLIIVPYLHKDD